MGKMRMIAASLARLCYLVTVYAFSSPNIPDLKHKNRFKNRYQDILKYLFEVSEERGGVLNNF